MFFSREHEPIHVHVRGHNGDAKFNWDGEGFVMEYAHNIKTNDLKRIERMIAENTDIIINRWYELFKTDGSTVTGSTVWETMAKPIVSHFCGITNFGKQRMSSGPSTKSAPSASIGMSLTRTSVLRVSFIPMPSLPVSSTSS